MMKRMMALAALVVLTAACATTGGGAGAAKAGNGLPLSLAGDDGAQKGLGPLADPVLPESKCGMLLWTLEGARPAAIFRFVSGGEAEINFSGRPVILSLAEFSGASGYGVYEKQRFTSAEGLQMEITARFGLEFNNGAYLEKGLIRITDSAGWSMVAPTAGIAGCR